MRKLVQDAGLRDEIEVDSAGTIDYHVGSAPDSRAQSHASRRGYDLSFLRARQFSVNDFQQFDMILAMDRSHLAVLDRQCPPVNKSKLRLFMDFVPDAKLCEVPDPYYGGAEDFEHVLDLVEAGCSGLLEHIQAQMTLV